MKKLGVIATVLLATAVASNAFAAPKRKKVVAAPPPPPAAEPAQAQAPDEDEPATGDEGGFTSNPSGFELGGHTGFSLPLGSLAKDLAPPDLSKYIAGAIPFALDMGYRVSPKFFIGGFFHFAYAPTSSELCARTGGDCSSSATQIKFGPQVRYTFTPEKRFSMWIGGGTAYEVLNVSITQGQASSSYTVKGWEFIRADIGGDFHAARDFVVGPYASIGLGQYFAMDQTSANGNSRSSDFKNTALHEWLTFGIRLAYTF